MKIPKFIRNLIIIDWKPKLAALIIGTLVWSYVVYSARVTKEFKLQVQVRNLPPNLRILNPLETIENVTVRITGDKDIIQQVNEDMISCYLDLSHASPGKKDYPVMLDLSKIPDMIKSRVKISNYPRTITLTLKKISIKYNVPIKIRPEISVAKGYKIVQIEYNPKTIIIRGDEDKVEKVNEIIVPIIIKHRIRRSIDGRVIIQPPFDGIEIIGPRELRYYIEVSRNRKTKSLKRKLTRKTSTHTTKPPEVVKPSIQPKDKELKSQDLPMESEKEYLLNVDIINPSSSLKIVNKTDLKVQVILKGPPEVLAKVADVKAFINIAGYYKPGIYLLPIDVVILPREKGLESKLKIIKNPEKLAVNLQLW